MSSAVPPTPLFPRFAADNSLLLSTEPIFDVSFEEITTELPTPKPLHTSTKNVSKSANRMTSLRTEKGTSRDDLYARRVSDARRRSLSRPSSPFLSSTNLASSSRLIADTSIESEGEVSRVHLAWKSRPPGRSRNVEDMEHAEIQPVLRLPSHSHIAQDKGTALSRYLAKSALNRPAAPSPLPIVPVFNDEPLEFARFASPVQTAPETFPDNGSSSDVPEVLGGEVDPVFGLADEPEVNPSNYTYSLRDPPSPIHGEPIVPDSTILSGAADVHGFAIDDLPTVSLRPDSIPPTETSHSPVTSASTTPPTPDIPFPTLADLSDTDGETSMMSQNGSRRKSRSEGLVNFFTDFLRGSTSMRAAEVVKTVPERAALTLEVPAALGTSQTLSLGKDSTITTTRSSVAVKSRPLNAPYFTSLTRPAKQRPPMQSSTAHTHSSNITKPVVPNPLARKPPVPRLRPATNSALANAALAKLPPPGKGSTRASNPIKIRTPERARDLPSRRKVFEGKVKTPPKPITRPVIARTIPLSGRTPGKASRIRSAQRDTFDQAVKERNEQRDRERRDLQRKREEEEEEEYQKRRKETIIRAHPVPDMYKRVPPLSK